MDRRGRGERRNQSLTPKTKRQREEETRWWRKRSSLHRFVSLCREARTKTQIFPPRPSLSVSLLRAHDCICSTGPAIAIARHGHFHPQCATTPLGNRAFCFLFSPAFSSLSNDATCSHSESSRSYRGTQCRTPTVTAFYSFYNYYDDDDDDEEELRCLFIHCYYDYCYGDDDHE